MLTSSNARMRTWQKLCTGFERHSHNVAYAAVVIAGSYEEAGDQGRLRVQAGDVIFHDRFEAHLDRVSQNGAMVLNLLLPTTRAFKPGKARVYDPDTVLQKAQVSCVEAAELLLATVHPQVIANQDWPDELAADLIENPSLKLSTWGEERRLSPWTLSRGFQQVFGTTPEAFRARSRTRVAWKTIQATTAPLVEVALTLGFADQSHMTRSVKQITGLTPQAWRSAANGFKTSERARL